ncbi:hypothetical protein BZA77DRAFT_244754 [Pyronema omphalodes]|nr:hypothetical protein BZA77DRAFT_244754 [Pyronema omphalodes]
MLLRASISSLGSSSTTTPASCSTSPSSVPSSKPSKAASAPSITSSLPPNRVLSTFNPTRTFHIPSHGGLLSSSIPINDLTLLLRDRPTSEDTYTDRKLFKKEVRALVKSGNGMQVAMSLSGGNKLKDSDGRVVAEWEVPWGLWKEVPLTIRVGGEEEVQVWTGDYDPRSQEFEYRGASYRWKFTSPRELILEKQASGIGRYIVGTFYLTVSSAFFPADLKMWAENVAKRGVGSTEGTLLFDARGIDPVVATATCLIALKRERQRWGVLGGTI